MEHDPHHESNPDSIEMPAPSSWPMVLAFGLTLLLAGLVTHVVVSIVGIIVTISAAIGWWRDVIPQEAHEQIPIGIPSWQPQPVRTTGRSVAQLHAGEDHHRMRIPETIHPYSAGVWGGLAGGTAMAGLACLYGLIAQGSIWYPINLMAGAVIPSIGEESLKQLQTFDAVALAVGFVAHGVVSILVGVLYAVILPMFPKRAALWGGIIAPLLWTGLVAATLDFVNPALNSRISWPWFIACQLGFGLVGGFVVARSTQIHTMQSWSFAERVWVDAPGMRPPRDNEEEQ